MALTSEEENLSVAELRALLAQERAAHARTEKRRTDELAGRKTAEAHLRKAVLQARPLEVDDKHTAPDGYFPLSPIGMAQSCFIECGGVPRQPGLATSTRAVLQFDPSIGPGSFDGLEKNSHIWVLFVFHCNTNVAKIAQMKSRAGTYSSKIAPPRLGGSVKVGVFATRTPHHPNPIGLSLAKLEKVDPEKRQVIISGSDLVDGSPILDIKPFVPWSDTPRESEGPVLVPWWTGEEVQPRVVRISALAEEQLQSREVVDCLRVFRGDAARLRTALLQVLSVDVGRRPRKLPYVTLFDGVSVQYTVVEGGETEVQFVHPHKYGAKRPLAIVDPEHEVIACSGSNNDSSEGSTSFASNAVGTDHWN